MSNLREDSGAVDDTDPFVSLLYSLLRDYVCAGDLEDLVQEIEGAVAQGSYVTQYTNGYLAKYARNLVRRLQGAPFPMDEARWRALSDAQRLALIQSACVGCGTLDKPCTCMRDE